MKMCNKCEEDKEPEEFGKRNTESGKTQKYQEWCKVCSRAYSKEWAAVKRKAKKIANEAYSNPFKKPLMDTNEVDEIYIATKTIKFSPEDYEILSDYNWNLSSNGDVVAWGKHILTDMASVILEAKPNQKIDYINGNKLDNRRENIRFTPKEK